MGGLQIVWFKRDLRIQDHRPLAEAARHGPVLPLLVVEPELWRQPDASGRQWAFCAESLRDLDQALRGLGQPLVIRSGDVVEVLRTLHRRHGVAGLWSHQETGNGWTYARDRRVGAWLRNEAIGWIEHRPFGVVRRLRSRNGWARQWEALMGEEAAAPPARLEWLEDIDPGTMPTAEALGLSEDPCPQRQQGGRRQALVELSSFLQHRGERYHRELSSPLTAFESCSRLSPHLAWGTLSMREVVQASRQRRATLASLAPARATSWRRALEGFEERLHWHCHFIQKLECEPALEFRELHPATAGMRHTDPERLAAWAEGRTGLPFVDACMRALRATGWINFRMRAMLMSVASYHLWLDWRDSGLELARMFVDYEPGIHWSQCQMQSGTTGINTIRVYNPIKQGLDHDPQGVFLRRWLPELQGVPVVHLHEPWAMDMATQARSRCVLGVDYPLPIVDVNEAAKEARERMWALREQPEFASVADAIQRRHGSRRSGLRPSAGRGTSQRSKGAKKAASTSRRQRQSASNGQLSLDLSC